MKKENELMVKETFDLLQPQEMVKMSTMLKQHIVKQNLYTPILGKNYVQVEGWSFAGGLLGLYPRMSSVENLSTEHEIKWRADVEIVRLADDKVISRGFALCSNKENKKRSFDEYAILSMSQTRAISKAYRNIIGWVIKMSGYEGTPSEEMVKVGEVVQQGAPHAPEKASAMFKDGNAKPAPHKEIVCHQCAEIITDAESKYSQKLFKKNLCRSCQKEFKR